MKKLLIGLSAFLLFSPLHVFAAESGLSDTALGKHPSYMELYSFCWYAFKYCDFPFDKGRMVGKT